MYSLTEKFNAIVWGDPGAGKTPFCGTLEAYPKTSPSLFLDVDHGTLSLNSTTPCPTIYTVDNWADVQTVYGHLKSKRWQTLAELIEKHNPGGQSYTKEGDPKEYKSAVLDSGTDLASSLLRTLVEEDDRNEGVADQGMYQRVQIRFSALWRSFTSLPMSVVMTAGVRDQKDELMGLIRYFPEFSPGLLHDLLRHTDLIFFMNFGIETEGSQKKWTRYIQTQPTQRYVARDRSSKLQPRIEGEKIYWKDILDKVMV